MRNSSISLCQESDGSFMQMNNAVIFIGCFPYLPFFFLIPPAEPLQSLESFHQKVCLVAARSRWEWDAIDRREECACEGWRQRDSRPGRGAFNGGNQSRRYPHEDQGALGPDCITSLWALAGPLPLLSVPHWGSSEGNGQVHSHVIRSDRRPGLTVGWCPFSVGQRGNGSPTVSPQDGCS